MKKKATAILSVIMIIQMLAVSAAAGEAISFYKADNVEILENVTSQAAFDTAISEYTHSNFVRIKQDITSEVSFSTVYTNSQIYGGTSLDMAHDGDITTQLFAASTAKRTLTVNLNGKQVTDFFVLFGSDSNHVRFEEIEIFYEDSTSEVVMKHGSVNQGRFFHITLPSDKKAIKLVITKLARSECFDSDGEVGDVTKAYRMYVNEVVVLSDYVPPYEDEYGDEVNPEEYFEEYENSNDVKNVTSYLKGFATVGGETDGSIANSEISGKILYAVDNNFDTNYTILSEDGTVTRFVLDKPAECKDVFLVFDIFEDKDNNDIYRYFTVKVKYTDGEEVHYTPRYELPPQIMRLELKSEKKLSEICIMRPPVDEISTMTKPSGASYSADSKALSMSEIRLYAAPDFGGAINIAYKKNCDLYIAEDSALRFISAGKEALTDGYELDWVNSKEGVAVTYDEAKKFAMILDLESMHEINEIELFGKVDTQSAEKDTLKWAKTDLADIVILGSADGKSYFELGKSPSSENFEGGSGKEKYYCSVAFNARKVRYIKLFRDSVSGYVKLTEIKVFADVAEQPEEYFTPITLTESTASTSIVNCSEYAKSFTLFVIQYNENGNMIELNTKYVTLQQGERIDENDMKTPFTLNPSAKSYMSVLATNLKAGSIIAKSKLIIID